MFIYEWFVYEWFVYEWFVYEWLVVGRVVVSTGRWSISTKIFIDRSIRPTIGWSEAIDIFDIDQNFHRPVDTTTLVVGLFIDSFMSDLLIHL